jgi:hypothetical protein
MCLIAVREKGTIPFPLDKLQNAQNRNDDGWGIMVADGQEVRAVKKVGGWNTFEREFKSIDALGLPTAVHFRFATQGAKNDSNCHPFKVLDRQKHGLSLYMMHNGTLGYKSENAKDKRSDTALFVDQVVRPVLAQAPNLIRQSAFHHMLYETIGRGNKLVFMEGSGAVWIINKEAGDVQDGIWFSNTYSLSAPTQYYAGWGGYMDGYKGDSWRSYRPALTPTPAKDSASVLMPNPQYERDNAGVLWACEWKNGVQTRTRVEEAAKTMADASTKAEDAGLLRASVNTDDTKSPEFMALVGLAVDVRRAAKDAKDALKASDSLIDINAAADELADGRAEVERSQVVLRDARVAFWTAQNKFVRESTNNAERIAAGNIGVNLLADAPNAPKDAAPANPTVPPESNPAESQHGVESSQDSALSDEESYYAEMDSVLEALPGMSEQEIFDLVTERPELAADIIMDFAQ